MSRCTLLVWLALVLAPAGCDFFYPPLRSSESSDGSSTTNCNGTTVITAIDPDNCGACDRVCPASHRLCLGGRCCTTGIPVCE